MKKLLIAAAIALTASGAVAQTQIERMEAIGEGMFELMFEAMISEIEAGGTDVTELRAAIPDTSWDDPMREAGTCVLEAYEARAGADSVEQMLTDIEAAMVDMEGMSMDEMDQIGSFEPEGITEAESMQINSECGMIDLMMEKMMTDDFMTLMMEAMSG